jgi:hypothetical protein
MSEAQTGSLSDFIFYAILSMGFWTLIKGFKAWKANEKTKQSKFSQESYFKDVKS